LLSAAAACGDGSAAGPEPAGKADSLTALPRTLTATEQQGVAGVNVFAYNLLRQAAAASPASGQQRNLLLSPLSVQVALGMTMNGAAGTTFTQMQQVLGWGGRSRAEINAAYRSLLALLPTLDPTVTVSIGNGIWTRTSAVPDTSFVREAREFFSAPVQSVATASLMRDSVNTWVQRSTRGLIPTLLEQAPPEDLQMMLVNAVYFDGAWRDRFDVNNTRLDGTFTLASGAPVTTPMMRRTGGFSVKPTIDLGAGRTGVAAELPFGNSAYSMLLLMPTTGGIDAVIQRLDTAFVGSVVRSLEPQTLAFLGLPRFTLRASRQLNSDLTALGMSQAFSDAAEFPRLVTNVRTKIGFVQHGVSIAVTERGARAGAATAVGIMPVSLPAIYEFDRPFVFMIRERFTGTVLFIGVVHDPRS
jgi:serpin B